MRNNDLYSFNRLFFNMLEGFFRALAGETFPTSTLARPSLGIQTEKSKARLKKK